MSGGAMPLSVLRWPPPLRCEGCGKLVDVFASRVGWLCWSCLPVADRCDRGVELPRPEITPADRRALMGARRRLAEARKRKNPRTTFQPQLARRVIGARARHGGARDDRGLDGRTDAHPLGASRNRDLWPKVPA